MRRKEAEAQAKELCDDLEATIIAAVEQAIMEQVYIASTRAPIFSILCADVPLVRV